MNEAYEKNLGLIDSLQMYSVLEKDKIIITNKMEDSFYLYQSDLDIQDKLILMEAQSKVTTLINATITLYKDKAKAKNVLKMKDHYQQEFEDWNNLIFKLEDKLKEKNVEEKKQEKEKKINAILKKKM